MHRRSSSKRRSVASYVELRMLFLVGSAILLGVVALPFLLRASDVNGDNLDDAWEAQYGISTNAYDSTNLVGWWQLNGTNSTDAAVDRSGNHIDGTLTNFPSIAYQPGLFSNALEFTTNSTVGFPTTNSVLNVGTNFTYSAWFQATQTNATEPTVIADWHDSESKGWQVGASATGTATITLYDGATQTVVQGTGSVVNLYDGGWHQIAATVDTNSVATVYADGQAEATNSVPGWSPGSVSSFTFGVQGSTNNVPFNLDEVRLYDRALAAREVPRLPATYSDLNGSGLSVFEDQEENLNPRDTNAIISPSFVSSGLAGYYGSNTPVLTRTGGDAQAVSQNSFAANALVVHVADASNNPLANAPVTFSIQSGSSGLLSQTGGGTTATSVSLTTDGSGDATVYYEAGGEVLKNNVVVASAVSEAGSVSSSFTEYCGVQNGLVAWYDADTGVIANGGGYVSQWTDQSAAGNNATQSDESILPSLEPSSLAGHPVIQFDGSSQYLSLSSVIQDDFTMVVVFRSNMGSGSNDGWYNAGGIVDGETPGVQNDFGMSLDPAGEVLTGTGNPDTSVVSSVGGYNDGRGHIATFIRGESDGSMSQYMDSVFQNTLYGNTGTLDAPPQLTIGATQTLAQYFGGDVAEVLLYQRDLSGDEQAQIEGFLADKYGLYSANATWPSAYDSDVQYQITANRWTKSEADAYVSFVAGSPAVSADGLLLWLKADSGVELGGDNTLSEWQDQSPSGHVLVPASGAGLEGPYLQIDPSGHYATRFSGNQAMYMPDYLPANGDITLISVAAIDAPSNFETLFVAGSPNGNTTRGLNDFYGSMNFDTYFGGAQAGPVANPGEEAISTITFNRGSGATNFYLRGSYNGYGNVSANDLSSGFVAGNAVDYSGPLTGNISEILVYNRVLGDTERAAAEGYLADRYGVYAPSATWPSTYDNATQELIAENAWSQAQADAYVASLGSEVREVVVSPPPGHYSSAQTITVTSPTSGATIYYTTDGSKPTTSSTSVANGGTLTVSGTTRYRFMAADGTDPNSPVTSAVYVIGSLGNLVAGDSFTMVNKPDGTVWTWGDNGRGQEGDNQANNPIPFPQQVTGFGTIVNVAAAGDHALAVDDGGNVWAWGADDQSQGGDGNTNDLLVPTEISGLSNIATVWTGSENGFAVDTSGNLYGWGNNDNGQLGDGTNNSESTPEPITSVSNVVKVVSNPNFSMVLESDGSVWASGNNDSGESGDGTFNSENTFQQVPNVTNVVDIAIGGSNALVLCSDGTVWAWGNNWDGELADGDFNSGLNFPRKILGLPPAVAVEAVNNQCFVVLADGTLRSFGANSQGTLGMGIGNSDSQATPIKPPGVHNVAMLAAGSSHTVICTTAGAFYGWGDNSNYRLTEDFAPNNFTINSEVHDPAWQNVTQVVSDDNTTVALESDGTVWAVGEGDNGTLGNGHSFNTETPVQTVGLSGITKIAGGNQQAFAIDSSGNLWAWGSNWSGQLGTGDNGWRTSPVQVSTVANVTDVAEGDSHMLAVESDGTVWAVGDDSYSELGDGTTNSQTTPIQISSLTNVTKVAAGTNTSFALDSSGAVWAWGENDSGELGLGTTDNVGTPTQITSLPTMVAISAQGNNAMGIDPSGNVWTWGEYGNGDGTPLEQAGISNVTAVSAANYHGVALKSDGTVWGLGSGWLGALGNDSFNDDSGFTQFGGVAGVQGISASYSNTLLLKGDGTLSGFGGCGNGQLAANLGVYAYAHKPMFGIAMSETPPSISITSPTTGATATEDGEIDFQASASASTGSITKVEYYLNGVRVGTSTAGGNWDYSWSPNVYGELVFQAVAHDTAGVAQVSAPVTVNVAESEGPPPATDLTITPGGTPEGSSTIYVSWTNPDGATSILIQRQNADGSWTTIAIITDPTTTSYAISGLTIGQPYNFRVVESNASGSRWTSIAYNPSTSYPTLVMSKVSADPTVTSANTFLAGPLTVSVQTSGGAPLRNVPVVFSLGAGSHGGLALTNGGTTASTQTALTNASGQASIFYQSGSDSPLPDDTIIASTSSGTATPSVSFQYGVGGLVTWLRADASVTVDGSNNVTAWQDQGPNAYSFTPAASPGPVLAQSTDGHAEIQFTGTEALTLPSTINPITAGTVITVASPNDGTQVTLWGSTAGPFSTLGFGYGYGDQATMGIAHGPSDVGDFCFFTDGGADPTPTEAWIMSDYEFDYSTNTIEFFAQGVANGTASSALPPSASSFSNLSIGFQNSDGAAYYPGWNGSIAEVLVYDHVLSDSERQTVEAYLEAKYSVTPGNPSVTPNAMGQYNANVSFSYSIQATNDPTSYSATGLPDGVSINTSTGVISGAATEAGTYEVVLTATNAGGSGSVTLPLTIYPDDAPAVTSATTVYGTAGQPINTYTITGSNLPTGYGGTDLPDGFTYSAGSITGTAAAAGTYTATVSASNAYGTGTMTLTFVIYPTLPVTSGLVAWYNAASVDTTAGGYVNEWDDQSGNGHNVTQSTQANQPQVATDFSSKNPVVAFNGQQFLASPDSSGIQTVTIIAVTEDQTASQVGSPEAVTFGGWDMGYGSNGYGLDGPHQNFHADNNSSNDDEVGGTLSSTKLEVGTVTFDATTGAYNFYVSGTAAGSGTASPRSADVGTGMVVGYDMQSPDYNQPGNIYADAFNGNIAELVVFNRVLSSSERQQVEAYLAGKYSIGYSLPAPTITPNGGSYSSVTISTVSPAVVHYTMDGSAPTPSSPVYSGTLTLTQSCPLTCAYFMGNFQISPTASAQFYVDDTGQIGISDTWQTDYFGHTGIDPNALAPGGSGLTNLQAYLYGYNPTLYSTNGDGLSDLVNHQLGYAGNNYDINGDGLTNAQDLAAGLDPFDSGVNPPPSSPPAGTPGDTVPPTITLVSPEGATLEP